MTPFSTAALVLWPAQALLGSPAGSVVASELDADTAASDQFGYAVAVAGERVLVGCPLDDLVGIDSGSAYVFERVGSEWVQSVKLGPPSNALSGDWFGAAVALAGDIAVVGGQFTSAAWVFENVGGVWLETAELLPGDGDADGFGSSVAVAGERVLVGAFADDDLALNAGQVFVFEKGPGGWSESASFGPASLDPNDWFGASVALDGDLALVGAPGDDEEGVTTGARCPATSPWSAPGRTTVPRERARARPTCSGARAWRGARTGSSKRRTPSRTTASAGRSPCPATRRSSEPSCRTCRSRTAARPTCSSTAAAAGR
jgi:hypothetical protein